MYCYKTFYYEKEAQKDVEGTDTDSDINIIRRGIAMETFRSSTLLRDVRITNVRDSQRSAYVR